MDFNELTEMVKSDFELNEQHLQTKIREIPNLHNKYLRYFFKEKTKLITLENSLNLLFREKWYYYMNDFDYKVEKKHLTWHVESDPDYSKLLVQFNKQKHLVDFFEQTLKKCNTLSFDIKNLIDYKKFMVGEN